MSVDRILERLTNVAIVVSAIVFVGVVLTGWNAPTAAGPGRSPRYVVGQKLEQLDARFSFASASRTVLVFTNSNCQYCQASMPFYKQLVARRDAARAAVPIVAIAKQPEDVLKSYLTMNGLSVDHALGAIDPEKFAMNVTPTVLVVDSQGVITHIWVGLIPAAEEEQALKAMLLD